MDQSKINVRYAKAFFSLAKEKGLTTELRLDAELIASVCSNSSDFQFLLDSPLIATSGKKKAISSIFEGKINPLSLKFLLLITDNKREKYLPGIYRYLEDLYRKEEGIKTAIISTAQTIDAAILEQIRKTLENEFSSKVEISQNTNPELIGGFVLRIDDKQYDASISSQLKKIKEKLLHTELK